ncbi:MAG TPA: cytochrome P460 family protein [Bacteroidales bacterium]|nr:cytochrome P460 family protein [Bacteroidales bacterium]
MSRTFFLLAFVAFASLAMILSACKKDKEAEGIDKQLLDMAKKTSGFTWYKNSDALLDKSAGSGHNYPFLRTRFNDIASDMLDQDGKIIDTAMFAEGSLIVKELYSDASTIGRYAILYKQSNSSYADGKGWIWGYINADGTVAESADKKGSSCIGCHSQQGNIDYMLMNKFFP